MFTAIAPRYDLLNHVLSCNIDRVWWRRTARAFAEVLAQPGARVLDLCCGTGDMALALLAQSGQAEARIVGIDFSHAMLQRAQTKSKGTPLEWLEADALKLPFPSSSFDLVTSAFGFRNLADYDTGLLEIARVLKPGGKAGILDFGVPRGIFGRAYKLYFRQVLPRIGTWISGIKGPYSYLPASVERFPGITEMLGRMRGAGLEEVSWTPYTFGIAGLYCGQRIGKPIST
jgi:demethylmenaquinone methyltransferase / 2-methoxy-6-polyprenyl-1,4-benzoquinol methylase